MRILLVCNAGMSTSMLVKKIKEAGKMQGLDLEVEALPFSEAERVCSTWDVIMLGPQVRHQLKRIQKSAGSVPVSVIDMRDYGMMNGANVLRSALANLNK